MFLLCLVCVGRAKSSLRSPYHEEPRGGLTAGAKAELILGLRQSREGSIAHGDVSAVGQTAHSPLQEDRKLTLKGIYSCYTGGKFGKAREMATVVFGSLYVWLVVDDYFKSDLKIKS